MDEISPFDAAIARVAKETDNRPVTRMTLAIGPDIDAGAAEQAWRRASAGTTAEGARVTWSRTKHTLSCFHCGRIFHGDRVSRCPTCSGDGLVLVWAPEVEVLGWATAPRAALDLAATGVDGW